MSDRGRDDLASALRGLAQSAEVPPLDPVRERALLEAFDVAQQQKRAPAARAGVWRPAAAAALLALAATMAWIIVGRSGRPPGSSRVAADDDRVRPLAGRGGASDFRERSSDADRGAGVGSAVARPRAASHARSDGAGGRSSRSGRPAAGGSFVTGFLMMRDLKS